MSNNPQAGANINIPSLSQLGGQGRPRFVRVPVYPTAPPVSTDPYVGIMMRYYGTTLLSTQDDYVVGSEASRVIPFDIPGVIFARAGSAFNTGAGNALPLGVRPLDTFLFRMQYSTGEVFDIGPRLASTCLGSGENPAEIGGIGFIVKPGASILVGITPLLANLRIDITLYCMEQRGSSNYSG